MARNTWPTIVEPVLSLFTFNMPDESVTDLKGVVVPEARVRIKEQTGPRRCCADHPLGHEYPAVSSSAHGAPETWPSATTIPSNQLDRHPQ